MLLARHQPPQAEAIRAAPLDTVAITPGPAVHTLWRTHGESLSIGLEMRLTESKCLLRSLQQIM